MAERCLDLGFEDRREVLDVAASALGRPSYLIEKDIWVVWAVETLFASSFGTHLVFKGGTSLSKAYRAIRRFSEDIDLTYDIRVLQPELVLDSPNALPPTRSQEKRWTKAVNESLRNWIGESVVPQLEKSLRIVEPNGNVSIDGSDVYIRYEALKEGTGYGKPEVKLEFGGRATGEPNTTMRISCDASDPVKDVQFPSAQPLV